MWRGPAGRIGVVFGQRSQVWWDLPLIDSLRLLRFLYRVPEERHAANLQRLRAMLALDEFIDTPCASFRSASACAVTWLGSRYALRDVTFQEPEIEDVIRRIYENGLLL